MLINKTGDILKATENIICHQVNIQGFMGGGLALQIARKYPSVESFYNKYAYQLGNDYGILKGKSCGSHINSHQRIENCFTQKPNFDTDYEAIEICFSKLLNECKIMKSSIAIPYKYGCGIAHGDWNKVTEILDKLSNEFNVDINIYRLEEFKND